MRGGKKQRRPRQEFLLTEENILGCGLRFASGGSSVRHRGVQAITSARASSLLSTMATKDMERLYQENFFNEENMMW